MDLGINLVWLKKLNILFLFLIILFIATFLVVSCSSSIIETNNQTIQNNKTVSAPTPSSLPDTGKATLLPSSITLCNPQWKCISSTTMAFQNGSCGFSQKTPCKLGCFNGTCAKPSTCEVGLKCKTSHTAAYQIADCSWLADEECPGGCEKGKCLFYNASRALNQTQSSGTPAVVEATPVESFPTLMVGEKADLIKNNFHHNLSIYIIDEGKVRLLIDAQKSDWINEGGNYFFYSSGINLTVREVLFQSYGVKQISYKIE